MSKILRALNSASSNSPWVVTPVKHLLDYELSEEASPRNIFKRSFYQKLLIALCLVIVMIHLKTMMMIRETQEQTFLVLSQLAAQKEQLLQINTSAKTTNGHVTNTFQEIYVQLGGLEKDAQTLNQKLDGVEDQIAKLNLAVSTADSHYESMRLKNEQVLEKLQRFSEVMPVQK